MHKDDRDAAWDWAAEQRRRAGFGIRSPKEIKALLQRDDASLYRNLSDPEQWALFPPVLLFALRSIIEVGPSAAELRRDRLDRMEEHRRVARDLRQFAECTHDPEKRTRFEQAAHMNDAMADTLEQLLNETLEDAPTPTEERVRIQSKITALENEEKVLRAKRASPGLHVDQQVEERLATLAAEIARLQDVLLALRMDEVSIGERVERDRVALDSAKSMVAEEQGRAKFKELEPHIRARLCAHWRACEQVKQYEDETALTMAIGDVLMAIGSAVPVATLAVLVVKIGVKKFCNCPA